MFFSNSKSLSLHVREMNSSINGLLVVLCFTQSSCTLYQQWLCTFTIFLNIGKTGLQELCHYWFFRWCKCVCQLTVALDVGTWNNVQKLSSEMSDQDEIWSEIFKFGLFSISFWLPASIGYSWSCECKILYANTI